MATVTTLSLLIMGKAGAQSLSNFHFGTWGGSTELDYGIDRQSLRSPDGSPGIDSARRRTQERLNVRNDGFYYRDPLIFTGNLALSFGLLQDQDHTNGLTTSRNAKLLGYAFDSTILSGLPYNGTIYANRTQNSLTQPFGRTDLSYENRGVTLRLREDSPLRDLGFPYLSANLRLEQQHTKETTTTVLGQPFQRDELRNVLGFDAHKGFETADLDMRYELNDLNNSAFPSASFRSQTANVNYSRDFGPQLNRRSDTRLFYFTRSGLSPMTLLTADQRLHLDHYENLATDYRYIMTYSDTTAGTSVSNNGIFDLRYKPYRDLTTNAQLFALQQRLPVGSRDGYAGQLGMQFRRMLPGNAAVFAGMMGRYQVSDDRFHASQISVVDEAQAAPAALGTGNGFLLAQSFVIPSSIVVVDTRGRARIATTPGVDYEVVQEGNLTRIVPLPTSAVIQANDPLAVSYSYQVDPSLKYSTMTSAINAGVDLRWLALSAGHEQSDQKRLSGLESQFLQNTRRDTAQLTLRSDWNKVHQQFGVGYVRYDSTRLAYLQDRYSEVLTYRPSRTLALGLYGDRTLTHYTLSVRETDARSARLTADWYAPGGWVTTALIGRRIYNDNLQPTETINEASLRAHLLYGKLDLTSAFTGTQRSRGGFEAANWRLDFLVIRRF